MDQLAEATDTTIQELTAELTELKIFGKVQRIPGKQFKLP